MSADKRIVWNGWPTVEQGDDDDGDDDDDDDREMVEQGAETSSSCTDLTGLAWDLFLVESRTHEQQQHSSRKWQSARGEIGRNLRQLEI